MSNFDNDPRRKQELAGRHVADKIYRDVFGEIEISREHETLLDIHHAIDVVITMTNGQIITGQEKFLSAVYAKYETVTVEYEQNQFTGEHGDWFKLASQIYFTGYLTDNGNSFLPYVLLNWPQTVIATQSGLLKWIRNTNNNGHAKASFVYCKMRDIPESCIIAGSR